MLDKITPNHQKALFLAQKQLPELVCDAVNLEGVNFTLPEVQTLLDGVTVGGHALQDQTITLNQAAAWRFLFARISGDATAGGFDLSATFVSELHRIVARHEALTWGKFRDGGVTIAGADYRPPPAAKLPALWARLAEKYQPFVRQTTPAIEATYTAAIGLFLEMARAQFFYDANKRVGRLMMNGVLLSCGLPIINLPAKRQLEFNRLMLDFYPSGEQRSMQTMLRACLDKKVLEIMGG